MNTIELLSASVVSALVLGVAVSNYSAKQKMLQMRRELDKLQAQSRAAHACSLLRKERARCHLQLQSLEAELTAHERTALSAAEIAAVDLNRKTIKNCVEALKNAGDWLGVPFDLEWVDMLERLPRLNLLYRASLDNGGLPTDVGGAPSPTPELPVESLGRRASDRADPATPPAPEPGESPKPDPTRIF